MNASDLCSVGVNEDAVEFLGSAGFFEVGDQMLESVFATDACSTAFCKAEPES